MSEGYGVNLKWFLHDVSCADSDQIESSVIDIYGETESGADTSCEVDLRELCSSALAEIKRLEHDAGMTRIELDHKTTLLASCEKALEERDAKYYAG